MDQRDFSQLIQFTEAGLCTVEVYLTLYNDDYLDNNGDFIVASDHQFFSVYVPEAQHWASFNSMGGSRVSAVSYGFNEELKIPSAVPVKEGCIFKGWSTSKTAQVDVKQPGDKVPAPNGDMQYYAIWKYAPPVFTKTLPETYEVAPYKTIFLSMPATGSELTYCWQVSKDNGQTWYSLTKETATAGTPDLRLYNGTDEESYIGSLIRCRVTNPGGQVYSTVTSIVSSVTYQFTMQPVSDTVLMTDDSQSYRCNVAFNYKPIRNGIFVMYLSGGDWVNKSSPEVTVATSVGENQYTVTITPSSFARDRDLTFKVTADFGGGNVIESREFTVKFKTPTPFTKEPQGGFASLGEPFNAEAFRFDRTFTGSVDDPKTIMVFMDNGAAVMPEAKGYQITDEGCGIYSMSLAPQPEGSYTYQITVITEAGHQYSTEGFTVMWTNGFRVTQEPTDGDCVSGVGYRTAIVFSQKPDEVIVMRLIGHDIWKADPGSSADFVSDNGYAVTVAPDDGSERAYRVDAVQNGVSIQSREFTVSFFDKGYGVYVGGTEISTANKDDVLKDGKVSYDPDSMTLTLDNASLTGSIEEVSDARYYSTVYSTHDLRIEIPAGTKSSVTAPDKTSVGSSFGIYVIDGAMLHITGRGELDVFGGTSTKASPQSKAIAADALIVEGVTLRAEGANVDLDTATGGASTGISVNRFLRISDADATIIAGASKNNSYALQTGVLTAENSALSVSSGDAVRNSIGIYGLGEKGTSLDNTVFSVNCGAGSTSKAVRMESGADTDSTPVPLTLKHMERYSKLYSLNGGAYSELPADMPLNYFSGSDRITSVEMQSVMTCTVVSNNALVNVSLTLPSTRATLWFARYLKGQFLDVELQTVDLDPASSARSFRFAGESGYTYRIFLTLEGTNVPLCECCSYNET